MSRKCEICHAKPGRKVKHPALGLVVVCTECWPEATREAETQALLDELGGDTQLARMRRTQSKFHPRP